MSQFQTADRLVLGLGHFDRSYNTFWEEHLYLSDHGDAPKVLKIFKKKNEIKQ